ncbi:MAG: HAMP domain-containing protein [Candidatus Hydrogenedentes bacterium]|nr:HAMP domain-containing protein [Candidatus Hydrogenedentota bacterium]
MGADAEPAITKVHWTNSLIARVVALCVVLVLCLLGSVYVLTVHFLKEVRAEYENRAFEMAQDAHIWFEEHREDAGGVDSATRDLQQKYPGVQLQMAPAQGVEPTSITEQQTNTTAQITDNGIVITATHIIYRDGHPPMELTAEFMLDPRTAIWRAFTNRYIALLTTSFLIALGLMVYFIVKSLRPMRDLAKSCARIGAGELAPVEIKRSYGEVLALERTFNRMVDALRDKEQIEANLRQAQRLSALGSLAAGIAHDVRNPLNAIKLLSSHALDNLNGNDNGAAQQLQTIRKEVDRLEDIVSGFLALAKERELQPEPVKVDALVEDCVHLVKAEAESHGVGLSSDLGAAGLQLDIDPKQVKRAVLNVMINAIEACHGGGRVRVLTRTTEDAYQIEVRDNGPGLTRDVAERAFDPYFTTKPSGTGIGLSITRGIFEEHGGSVSLTCAFGEGCQVLMSLPLRKTATV